MRRDRRRERGQSLVEFAILVPLFTMLLLGLLEFGFAFDHHLTLEYATREGARAGAALANGGKLGANCADVDNYVVEAVERVLGSPGSPVQNLDDIRQIRIFKATSTGTESGPVNVWEPGTTAGWDLHFKYNSAKSSYWDPCARSNKSSAPDSIGISLVYRYHAVTPLAGVMQFFGGGGWSQITITDRTIMALNPTS
jgi:hypothetical protein